MAATATSSMEAKYYDNGSIKFTNRKKDGGSKESIHRHKGLGGNPKGGGQTPKGDYNRALQADEWSNNRGDR